jgi:3,4-dihydroxy 2-butanone 4-phosphate synthase/GTP cyclohydrolase II
MGGSAVCTEQVTLSAADAIEAVRAGAFVAVLDAPDRQDQAELVIAAELVDAAAMNFLMRHARGVISLALPEHRCDELAMYAIAPGEPTPYGTSFAVSIEAREGVRTGISAEDRAHTVRTAVDPSSGPEALVQPGHIFPRRARAGGVLARAGHTEAAVDLTRLAGLVPGAVLCAVMTDDGRVARGAELDAWCRRHQIGVVTVAALVDHCCRTERPALRPRRAAAARQNARRAA